MSSVSVEPVTILALALHRGAQQDGGGGINGAEFERVGLAIMGGCEGCGASLAAYNGHPSKSGFWQCAQCLAPEDAWTDVVQANRDIFGERRIS